MTEVGMSYTLDYLEECRNALETLEFRLQTASKDLIFSLIQQWAQVKYNTCELRHSPLAIFPQHRKHYDAWIELCNAYLLKLNTLLTRKSIRGMSWN